MTGHLLVLDASGFAYRAYHAAPKRVRKDGLETHALLGVCSIIWAMLGRAQADPADYAVAVLDSPGRNFRHALYSEYKANRPKRPEGLTAQLRLLPMVVQTLGVHPVQAEGWEADDLAATFAARAKAEGIRTTIVSQDKDLLQTIEDDVCEVVDPVARVRMLSADVEKKFGVPPRLMPDLQALSGDSVDGIPGIPGVGLKKAAKILKGAIKTEDGRLILQSSGLTPADREKAALYLQLTTLRTDVPISVDFESLKPREVKRNHLVEMLRVLEAEDQFANLFGGDQRLFRPVNKSQIDPLTWWRGQLEKPGGSFPELPQCGFYKRRLVKGGPEVACRIWREPELDMENHPTGKDVLKCEVAGELQDPMNQWGFLASNPISEADYRHMMALAKWSRDHAKEDPLADPKEPVDWNKTPTPF